MPGHAELAHDEYVERRIEGARHLESDRHPAARQGEHQRVAPSGVAAKLTRELPARFPAVAEPHVGSTVQAAYPQERRLLRKLSMLNEVPRPEWPGLLSRFSREHRAWLATVVELRKGVQAIRAVERPLGSVVLEEPESLAIRFADGSPQVLVAAPRALRIEETPAGAECGLEIESPQAVTRLRFRAAALPETLDGVAPAER